MLSLIGQVGLAREIKNIILVIGDGMGPQQIGFLETFWKFGPKAPYSNKQQSWYKTLSQNGKNSLSMHYPAEALVTDSACSATQLAIGEAAGSEMIGINQKGNLKQNLVEIAVGRGKATGIISDTRATHATPAAFLAHTAHRSEENAIASQIIDSGADLILSGGLRHFLPNNLDKNPKLLASLQKKTGGGFTLSSKRKDSKNLLQLAEQKGFSLVFDQKSLLKAQRLPLLGLFSDSGMYDGIKDFRTRESILRTQPTLAQMTRKGLQLLSKNKNGFFLMVEAGQIDWAGHQNDAGWLLWEMFKLDETLGVIHQFIQGRNDTLVVITADHETGGFGISYNSRKLPKKQKLTGTAFKEKYYQPMFNFGQPSLMQKLMAQSRSFEDIFREFSKLPKKKQNANSLVTLVNQASVFKIDKNAANRILKVTSNDYYVAGHPTLGERKSPKIFDFRSFYPYGMGSRSNLLARELAAKQNVVWSTGTHTHTPVPVLSVGAASYLFPSGILHHVEIGKFLKNIIAKPAHE